jgi:hypothetical protein
LELTFQRHLNFITCIRCLKTHGRQHGNSVTPVDLRNHQRQNEAAAVTLVAPLRGSVSIATRSFGVARTYLGGLHSAALPERREAAACYKRVRCHRQESSSAQNYCPNAVVLDTCLHFSRQFGREFAKHMLLPIVDITDRRHIFLLASGIAFNLLLCTIPLVILVLSIVSGVIEEATTKEAVKQLLTAIRNGLCRFSVQLRIALDRTFLARISMFSHNLRKVLCNSSSRCCMLGTVRTLIFCQGLPPVHGMLTHRRTGTFYLFDQAQGMVETSVSGHIMLNCQTSGPAQPAIRNVLCPCSSFSYVLLRLNT